MNASARLLPILGLGFILISCGPSAADTGNPLSSLTVQSKDMPSGFVRCDGLSGQYPSVSSAYVDSFADGSAWRSIVPAEAADAWVEIYGHGSGACNQYRTASDPMATSGSVAQVMLIKYRTADTAAKAFGAGQFIPHEPAGFMDPKAAVLYGTALRGTVTGLGPESYVNAGTFGSYPFLHAVARKGQYVVTIFAESVTASVFSDLGPVLIARVPAPSQGATPTVSCKGTGGAGAGSISGNALSFPGPQVPALHIYAIAVGSPARFCSTTTVANQRSYTIGGLAAGHYDVIAYPADGSHLAAGYTVAVPCGLSATCNDRTLLAVTVGDGQAVTGINPTDWYTTALPAEPHS